MERIYLVGRSVKADLRIPKTHDAVGKRHLELTDLGGGRVTIHDLASTNGTFVGAAGGWERLKKPRTLDLDAEIMLGDYRTTPRALLALAAPLREVPAQKDPPPTEPRVRRPPRLRRNEFGEIVKE